VSAFGDEMKKRVNISIEAELDAILNKCPPKLRGRVKQHVESVLVSEVKSLESLHTALEDQKKSIAARTTLCWILGQLGDKRSVGVLLRAFNDKNAKLTWEAAKSLSLIQSKKAVRPLISALRESRDVEKCAAAVYALGHLRDNRTVQPLVNTLNNKDEQARVRGYAAEALAYLKEGQTVDSLIVALKDPAVEVRFWSAFALGQLGDRKAIVELQRVAATDKDTLPKWGEISKEAADAIERILSNDN